jgi:hypothetical protein
LSFGNLLFLAFLWVLVREPGNEDEKVVALDSKRRWDRWKLCARGYQKRAPLWFAVPTKEGGKKNDL